MPQRSQNIGVYQMDEVPEPLEYQFLDSDGVAIDLTGYAAEWWVTSAGVDAQYVASITTPAEGRVSVPWTAAMTADPGRRSLGVIWVTNGSVTHASDTLRWTVIDGPGPD